MTIRILHVVSATTASVRSLAKIPVIFSMPTEPRFFSYTQFFVLRWKAVQKEEERTHYEVPENLKSLHSGQNTTTRPRL